MSVRRPSSRRNPNVPKVIVRTKGDIQVYVKAHPAVVETGTAYGEGFDEIEDMLVKLILEADDRPVFNTDWSVWLEGEIEELLQEAVDIVM